MQIRLVPTAAALAAACVPPAGSTSSSGSEQASGPDALTVRITKKDVADAYLQRFGKNFGRQYKGTVFDIQEREGQRKRERKRERGSMSWSRHFPDVFEVGNTRAAQDAQNDGVSELSGMQGRTEATFIGGPDPIVPAASAHPEAAYLVAEPPGRGGRGT